MDRRLTVTYYHHSGFSVATEDTLLVFDYWTGEKNELPEDKRITPDFLRSFAHVFVFISHEHPDHMDPVVFTWRELGNVTYIVSADMPVGTRGKRMAAGDEITLSDSVRVRAFDSTDLGVSYLVWINGMTVFHAGDLNFWHWREESSIKEIDEAEEDFRTAVAPIAKESIDMAFFPVDPRQGAMFDAGANYFIMCVKPRILVPMHFWSRGEIAEDFMRRSRNKLTTILPMTRFGEKIGLEMDEENYITVHLLTAPEVVVAPGSENNAPHAEETAESEVDLKGYDGKDPFADSDLPIKLD